MLNYKYCFPDYDDTLPSLEGFSDCSYKNDTCPSIHKEMDKDIYLVLYCDYKNPNLSEYPNLDTGNGVYNRFVLMLDKPMVDCNAKLLELFPTIEDVKQFISKHTLEDFLNMEDQM
jgi:hypothetical protein